MTIAAPPPAHIAAKMADVKAWLDEQDAHDLAIANRGPTAAQRFDDLRRAQYVAGLEGRKLEAPPAPVHVAATVDPASMSASERWALARSSDQTAMPPWRDPRLAG